MLRTATDQGTSDMRDTLSRDNVCQKSMAQGSHLIQGSQNPRWGQPQLWQELVKEAHEEISLVAANINDHLGLRVPHNIC